MADREGLDAQDRQAAEFGKWLAKARGAQGLTQEQAATEAGVSRVQWARWEGGSGLPKRSNIPAIARAVRHHDEAEIYSLAGFVAPRSSWNVSHAASQPAETRELHNDAREEYDRLYFAFEGEPGFSKLTPSEKDALVRKAVAARPSGRPGDFRKAVEEAEGERGEE